MHTIQEVIEDIRQGKMIILVDDEDRENEGDLIIAAEKITPEAINFMAKYAWASSAWRWSPKSERLQLPHDPPQSIALRHRSLRFH